MIKRPFVTVLLVGLLTVLLDQLSKAWVLATIPVNDSLVVIPGVFDLTHITNTGAAFNLLVNRSDLFTVIAAVVVMAILWYARTLRDVHWPMAVSIGMLLGGALGNLVDRLHYGQVTDFIHVHFWPVFNLADSAVVVSVLLLAYLSLTERSPAAER